MSKERPLTDEEVIRLARWRRTCQEIDCNTEPADRSRAEFAISELYRFMGEAPPNFLWMDSPVEAVQLIGMQASHSLGRSMTYELQNKIELILKSTLESRVGVAFLEKLKSKAKRLLVTPEPLTASTGSIESLMRILVPYDWKIGRTEPYWRDPGWLLIESYAVCYEFFSAAFSKLENLMCCTFARDVMQIKFPDPFSKYLDLCVEAASSCGCWWAYREVCVISERPRTMHLDEDRRLHHPFDAALEFKNRFRLYMWHGQEVPETWIKEPDQIDPMCALTWNYIDLRWVAGEILGWERVFSAASGRIIDKHEDPEIGELIEVELPNRGHKGRFLKLNSPTGRTLVFRVPQTVQSALEANAWTYDLQSHEYRPEKSVSNDVKDSATQGDALFRRIPQLPAGVTKQNTKGWIVIRRSTNGHRHIIDNPAVSLFRYSYGINHQFLHIEVDHAEVVHDSSFDTQKTLRLVRGCWEVRLKREWNPN